MCLGFFSNLIIIQRYRDILSGLNPSIIGGFSGLCAFMGVAATFVSASLVKRLGILKVASSTSFSSYILLSFCILCLVLKEFVYQAGAAGLIIQASLLTVAVAVYCSRSPSQKSPLLFFLCLIVRITFLFHVYFIG